jgi:hypothetical protein
MLPATDLTRQGQRFSTFVIVPALKSRSQGQILFSGWGEQDDVGLNRLISMLLDSVETRADDVANWPNVSLRSVSIPTIGSSLACSLLTA